MAKSTKSKKSGKGTKTAKTVKVAKTTKIEKSIIPKTGKVKKEPSYAPTTGLSAQVVRPMENIQKKILAQRAANAVAATEFLKTQEEANPFEQGLLGTENDLSFDEQDSSAGLFAAPNGAFDGEISVKEMGDKEIFGYAYDEAQKYEDVPVFRILKNSALVGTEYYPCSWEKIQKKYGEGLFVVKAVRASKGTYIKSATQLIGAPTEAVHAPIEEKTSSSVDPMAIMALLSQERDKVEAKLREERRDKREEESAMMKLVLAMTQNQQQGKNDSTIALQQMMLDMQKTNFEMLKQMQNDTAKMFESLNNKKDTISNFELLKLVQDSRNGGWEQAQKFYEMLDKKAEEKAEALADARGGDEPAEKDSVTDTIIKSLVPVLGTVLSQPGQQARPQLPQRPPQVQHPRSQAQPLNPNVVVPPGTPTAQTSSQPKTGPTLPRADINELNEKLDIGEDEESLGVNDTAKGPVPHLNGSAALRSNKPDLKVLPNSNELGLDGRSQLTQDETTAQEIAIKDLAIPLIADKLVNGAEPRSSASEVILALQTHGIKAKDIVNHWPLHKLIAHAREMGVPEIADPWFKEFYSEIEVIAAPVGRDS